MGSISNYSVSEIGDFLEFRIQSADGLCDSGMDGKLEKREGKKEREKKKEKLNNFLFALFRIMISGSLKVPSLEQTFVFSLFPYQQHVCENLDLPHTQFFIKSNISDRL